MEGLTEVRLLGPAMVRTATGRHIRHEQWKTSKNRDLLRLLAVNHGVVLPVDVVLEALWPMTGPEKGRASLRTAIAHLRRVVGPEVVERVGPGLRLGPAWVDLAVYESKVAAAQRCFADGDVLPGLLAAREAVALRVGELLADDSFAEWASPARGQVERRHAGMLRQAAEAALGADLVHPALEFASLALHHDPCAEPAARIAMAACARRGDTASALRVFADLRRALAEELEVEPAPETVVLQAELLDGARFEQRRAVPAPRPPATPAPPPGEVEVVVSGLTSAIEEGRGHVAVLVGPSPAVAQALDEVAALLRSSSTSVVELGSVDEIDALPVDTGFHLGVLVAHGVDHPGQAELAALAARAVAAPPTVLVLGVSEGAAAGAAVAAGEAAACPDITLVAVGPGRTDGRAPVPVLDADTLLSIRVEQARAALGPEEQEVVDLLAVAAAPLPVSALARLSLDLPSVDACLRALAKLDGLGLMRSSSGGYRLVPGVTELAASWIRPGRRADLHERIAADGELPAGLRARHLLAAGRAEPAAERFLAAADDAARRGRPGDVHRSLWDARHAVTQARLDDDTTARWLRRIADVAAANGRTDHALDALNAAVRLLGEDDGGRGPSTASATRTRAPSGGADRRRRAGDRTGGSRAGAPAVEVRARLLVHRLWPARDLDGVAAVSDELDALPIDDVDDATDAFGHLARIEGAVWAGEGAVHLRRLRSLCTRLEHHHDPLVAARAAMALAWAMHELDDARFDEWWERAGVLAERAEQTPQWRALDCVVRSERGELADAGAAADAGWAEGAAGVPMALLGRARHEQRQGRRGDATATLAQGLVDARADQQLLLVPEMAARLAVLEAHGAPAKAASHLALAESVGGQGRWFPRERAWILLGQAALHHANGDLDQAEDLALRAEVAAASARLAWERRAITEAVASWTGSDPIVERRQLQPGGLQRSGA